jgi:hypothetical protein
VRVIPRSIVTYEWRVYVPNGRANVPFAGVAWRQAFRVGAASFSVSLSLLSAAKSHTALVALGGDGRAQASFEELIVAPIRSTAIQIPEFISKTFVKRAFAQLHVVRMREENARRFISCDALSTFFSEDDALLDCSQPQQS